MRSCQCDLPFSDDDEEEEDPIPALLANAVSEGTAARAAYLLVARSFAVNIFGWVAGWQDPEIR